MKIEPSKLTIKWMNYHEYKEQIQSFRQSIYVEEQGVAEGFVNPEEDSEALHLGAFYDGELVSSISAFFLDKKSPIGQQYGSASEWGRAVRYGMRMEAPSIRGKNLNGLLCAYLGKTIYEIIRPDRTFVLLIPQHQHLAKFYMNYWGKQFYKSMSEGDLLVCDGGEALLNQYLICRRTLYTLTRRTYSDVELPSLLTFLRENHRHDLVAAKKLAEENLYVAGVDLESELPRLSQQAAALFSLQSPIYDSVQKLPNSGRLLDIGSGAGVYLNLLSTHDKFKSFSIEGLEGSTELYLQAQKSFPAIGWHNGSAYQTHLESNYYDVLHCGFLFIHLTSPELAIEEMARLLKKQGLLYVVDVNDATFKGPKALSNVIKAHCDLYQGDRQIMTLLPEMARQNGLKLEQDFSVRVGVQSGDGVRELDVALNKESFLSMFDFVGQREEVSKDYWLAKQDAMASSLSMSINIQTFVFANR
ncbi:class I SAM-dependent methyltransferase [Pleionea sp. CnH1-48]|uniref:class I SAM-dependent methyltransferase n=1 Tax=Pleionea sp. CnH1-48 TaxID=2954494 RepID=UPI002097119C|nr:class I SAM-dependent methyltransferase [Pleionea sp. CnH1-48]MCO7225392.1 class I SAM-dependent methyltransferase [Pleionea sp. CnH1-48]